MLSACVSMPEIHDKIKVAERALDASTYVVSHGETFDTIAFRYQMTSQQLMALNPGVELVPGAYLRLGPSAGSPLAQSAESPREQSTNSTRWESARQNREDRAVIAPVTIKQAKPTVPPVNSDEALLGRLRLEKKSSPAATLSNVYPPIHGQEEIIEEETYGQGNSVNAALSRLFPPAEKSLDSTSVSRLAAASNGAMSQALHCQRV